MDASVRDASDGGLDTPRADVGPPPCDPEGTPDLGGVFVREGGTGDGTSPSSPLGSLSAALALARTGRTTIHVAQGTYTEVLDLVSPPAGLVIDGGWEVLGAVWRRDCVDGRAGTLLAPAAPVAARIDGASLGVRLAHLTIETAPPAAAPRDTAGGSRTALLVTGAGSAVTLEDVVLRARGGEDGGAAADPRPADAPSCDRVACGDGGRGSSGGAGGDGTPADVFDAAGYQPVDGQFGIEGGPGNPGTPGQAGYTAATNCCGLCNGGGGCSTTCNAEASVPAGRCGCGGRPGGAGAPGRGGGASVGLLIVGADATVSATYTSIESEAGGDGSAGGPAALPSPPTSGAPGTSECCTSCRVASPCPACSCFRESCTTHETTAGGVGGAAGTSGPGGAGAGGPSYSVVSVGGARFVGATGATNSLLHGAGGAGPAGNDGGAGTLLVR
jgi:hypothetical protein